MSKGIEIKKSSFYWQGQGEDSLCQTDFSGNSSSDEPVHRAHHKHFGRDPYRYRKQRAFQRRRLRKLISPRFRFPKSGGYRKLHLFRFRHHGSQRIYRLHRGQRRTGRKYASLLSVSLSSIKQYYDEKHDRANLSKRHSRQHSPGRHLS